MELCAPKTAVVQAAKCTGRGTRWRPRRSQYSLLLHAHAAQRGASIAVVRMRSSELRNYALEAHGEKYNRLIKCTDTLMDKGVTIPR